MDSLLSLLFGNPQSTQSTRAPTPAASSTGRANLDQAFANASAATGLPFDFFLTTAMRESSLDVNAAASTSSARGPFQFIEQTWLSMMHDHGAALGYSEEAGSIERHSDGRYRVPDAALRESILAMRHDPELSAVMTGLYVQGNAVDLENALGRPVTVGEGYVAHVFGPSGGSRLINLAEQQPNRVAADVFPTQAAANRGLFYTRQGEPVSVAALYERLTSGFSDQQIDTRRVGQNLAVAAAAPVPTARPITPASSDQPLALEPSGFDALPEASDVPPDDFARRGMFAASDNASVPFFAALYRPDGVQQSFVGEEFVSTHGNSASNAASPAVPNPTVRPQFAGESAPLSQEAAPQPGAIAGSMPLDLLSFVESGQLAERYRNPATRFEGSQLVPPV